MEKYNFYFRYNYDDNKPEDSFDKQFLRRIPSLNKLIVESEQRKKEYDYKNGREYVYSPNIALNQFVDLLYADGWVCTDLNEYSDSQNKVFRLYSEKNNVRFNIYIPILDKDLINKDRANVAHGIELLNKMYIKNNTKYKGKKHMLSIKKIFKNKPKLAIALCTLTAAITVVSGSIVVQSVVERKKTQEVINQNQKYSYQNDKSSDDINRNRYLYQAIKNGEIDDSLASPNRNLEEDKMLYNQQNYDKPVGQISR